MGYIYHSYTVDGTVLTHQCTGHNAGGTRIHHSPAGCWVKWNHAQGPVKTGPINEDEEMNKSGNNQTPEAEASDKSASTVTEAVCTTETVGPKTVGCMHQCTHAMAIALIISLSFDVLLGQKL